MGAFELAELTSSPYLGDVLLIVERLDGAGNVTAHAIFIVPEGASLVEKVKAVVGKEVGGLGQIVNGGLDLAVELLESRVRGTSVRDDGLRGDLREG